jgi:glyoxylase-like metal-dependent hydrolase (beta-lactamase superfamily II)
LSEYQVTFQAILACPTAAISAKDKKGIQDFMYDFPLLIEEDVYYSGYTSGKSLGGHSYFIRHPKGNWLIDAPRYVPALVTKLEELGGVDYIFLTHNDMDEFLDAVKYARQFGAKCMIHKRDWTPQIDAEYVIEEMDPLNWSVDFRIVMVPGHTAGHMVLIVKDKYLFSGDHLYWDSNTMSLSAPDGIYCFYSWSEQTKSMKHLSNEKFEWVLPRHGERVKLPKERKSLALNQLIQRMERANKNQL